MRQLRTLGLSERQISEQMAIPPTTVHYHVKDVVVPDQADSQGSSKIAYIPTASVTPPPSSNQPAQSSPSKQTDEISPETIKDREGDINGEGNSHRGVPHIPVKISENALMTLWSCSVESGYGNDVKAYYKKQVVPALRISDVLHESVPMDPRESESE